MQLKFQLRDKYLLYAAALAQFSGIRLSMHVQLSNNWERYIYMYVMHLRFWIFHVSPVLEV